MRNKDIPAAVLAALPEGYKGWTVHTVDTSDGKEGLPRTFILREQAADFVKYAPALGFKAVMIVTPEGRTLTLKTAAKA